MRVQLDVTFEYYNVENEAEALELLLAELRKANVDDFEITAWGEAD